MKRHRRSRKTILTYLSLGCFTLALSSCASTLIVTPPATPDFFFTYRWLVLGGGILFGFVQGALLEAIRPNALEQWAESFAPGFLGLPLQWTIIGEWFFKLWNWIASPWLPIMAILGFLNGLVGSFFPIIAMTVLLGFAFPSPQLLYWFTLPMIVGMGIHLIRLALLIKEVNQDKSLLLNKRN